MVDILSIVLLLFCFVNVCCVQSFTLPSCFTCGGKNKRLNAILCPIAHTSFIGESNNNDLQLKHNSVILMKSLHDNVMETQSLDSKYPTQVVRIDSLINSQCTVYLCGTLHVSKHSVQLVRDCVSELQPQFVVLELCEERLGTLEESLDSATLRDAIKAAWREKKWSTLGKELLHWLQQSIARTAGSKVGAEQSVAAKEGHQLGATIVLADRNYSVTMQRIMDRLSLWEKVKVAALIVWEVLTSSVASVAEYIRKGETDASFIQEEVAFLTKHMPAMAEVVLNERDEYIAQTILQVAQKAFPATISAVPPGRRGCIVAVVGAAHLTGVQRRLLEGGVSPARMREISCSSQHASTWPGEDTVHTVDTISLYGQRRQEISVV